ncbi:ABC transporter permease [Candidatus Pantoea floridensis]|uniref:NitT/TauT family transport system permease protein n=1 Tax=Candidatus Pantoea floridensis TaxID=1938870 RepID=A0A286BY25_9GAMM|nr:ABC transporter permease [Pantoea floridensis]PIF21529.1 NitT/TauT family transport system permease protein [Enterobacteriaceae bacterium JKS000233]SOD39040.1 NitT/TauT family transport system permease protein [Pantoea floridensis]
MTLLSRTLSLLIQRLVLMGIFLLAWWQGSQHLPTFILPSPGATWQALLGLWHTGTLFHDIGVTLGRVVSGFALAAFIGTLCGLVLGANPRVARFCEPLLAVLNTVSSAIWAIFAIIWFGISDATTVFVVFMTAMPLILTNVWQGALNVETQFVELARSFRMSRRQLLSKIYFPSILPYFFSGARLAFGFGWRVSLVAETLGSSDGIGYRLRQAGDLVQTSQVFAWTLLLVALMLLLEGGLLKPLERHIFRWKKRI